MASKDGYSPVDRRSFSADDGSRSLLSHDEKIPGFERRRPAQRRLHFILKSILVLFVLVLHAGLIAFLLNWFGYTIWGGSRANMTSDGMTGQHSHVGHSGSSCQTDSTHHRYGFEGVIPAVYKDPSAEFSQVNPCGHSATEARARGCRYGMLYGAWLPEECYDEETEENFKKYTNWRFWLQANRTEEVSWDEVAKGEHEYVLVEWECEYCPSRRFHSRHNLEACFNPLHPQITSATAPR